jgi:hypothetical protein
LQVRPTYSVFAIRINRFKARGKSLPSDEANKADQKNPLHSPHPKLTLALLEGASARRKTE